jgi:uncharacterized protein (TIGR04255 family)
MPKSIKRLDGLPDFNNPPLNEVVLGVQFVPPLGYQQIHAGEVWSLFKDSFPEVVEQPPLSPQFETFGFPQQPKMSFGLMTGSQHDRFWFVTKNGEKLIQFQNDRLHHNWRKVGDETNPYPRFEFMIADFESELRAIEKYFSTLHPQALNCNQVEMSYINHLIPDKGETTSDLINIISDKDLQADDFNFGYRRIVNDTNGQPCGRFYVELLPAVKQDGTRVFSLNLTVRGAPSSPTIDSALQFMKNGRELIVKEFDRITTESAHERWKRV